MSKYKEGKIVKGCITGVEAYGIFINLDNYYSGLIHISEISSDFVRDIKDYVEIGETIYAKVIEVNEKENQVKLSIKGIDYRVDKEKKVYSAIEETGSGFEILKKNLSKWINEKKG